MLLDELLSVPSLAKLIPPPGASICDLPDLVDAGTGTNAILATIRALLAKAETGDADGTVLDHARAKFARKACDLLVVNEVGVDKAFGQDDTSVHVLTKGDGAVVDIGPASKRVVSDGIWDVVVARTRG